MAERLDGPLKRIAGKIPGIRRFVGMSKPVETSEGQFKSPTIARMRAKHVTEIEQQVRREFDLRDANARDAQVIGRENADVVVQSQELESQVDLPRLAEFLRNLPGHPKIDRSSGRPIAQVEELVDFATRTLSGAAYFRGSKYDSLLGGHSHSHDGPPQCSYGDGKMGCKHGDRGAVIVKVIDPEKFNPIGPDPSNIKMFRSRALEVHTIQEHQSLVVRRATKGPEGDRYYTRYSLVDLDSLRTFMGVDFPSPTVDTK